MENKIETLITKKPTTLVVSAAPRWFHPLAETETKEKLNALLCHRLAGVLTVPPREGEMRLGYY